MHYDMHYYGTYAMAAAAGIPTRDAEIIATSAQFVDDQEESSWMIADSGEGILGVATAYRPHTAESANTRPVWVPFHFLPGAQGSSFRQRMICRQDSEVVNHMLDFYLSDTVMQGHRGHMLHLMGIAAHVYADTFSHCGFSGLADEAPAPAELDAILINQDLPYLRWSFVGPDGEHYARDNQAVYTDACAALYRRFVQFAALFYGGATTPLATWEQLAPTVRAVLATQAQVKGRVSAWRAAMAGNALGPIDVCQSYDAQAWLEHLASFRDQENVRGFERSHPFLFFAAADYHRSYVLKRLLPQWGLMAA